MLGGIRTDLLVKVVLLFLTQAGTRCRAENDFSLVTLPESRAASEYVTQCFRHNSLTCDWTTSQQRTAPEDVAVNVLESGPLWMEGKACLEFWYLAPAAANGSELRVLLKSSTGQVEIWTSPALPKDAWRQVFVPLDISEPGTQVVFEAVEPVSVEEEITFTKIGVRRGSCGQQCESNTELWTDESTRCLCSVGQLFCFPSQCPQGQICGPQRGGSNETSTSGMCTIHSHTDCSTFDGVLFRFMAPCTYVLAKTCSATEALPVFSVEVVNEQNGNTSLPTVQQIIVDIGNVRVSLLKRQTRRVVVNGVWRKLPLVLGGGAIDIKSNPAAIVLRTSFDLIVSFDNTGAVHVTLPSIYHDKVCGMCGNFNQLKEDDFSMPDGSNAEDATALAESWQTGETTSTCETILVPHECDPVEEAEYAGEMYCGGLLSSIGPFADCLSVLGAESYFRSCVVGMCSSHGDPAVLCETLQVYAGVCQEAGVAVPIWRNSTFCPLRCGENSHYNSCADGCPEVCSSLDIAGSCGSCEERCECDSGFKLSGGKCVPAEDCGCWYKGKHYEKGETLVKGDCVQQCQCMGNNAMRCIAMQCADTEVCKVKDGLTGCYPFNPATCTVYGDPHYVTFDRLAYDFQGGCSYTLTTTCGGESSVQFAVIGHNMHPPDQNYTRSKLEAVSLEAEDLKLTLNQSGLVYVNNKFVQLPYSTNGSYGSVWVYKKKSHIILETTFGLRMAIDGQYRLFLQVDERYKYELCGLCGTYSGYQDDDFVTPGGQNTTDPFKFGDSWRVSDKDDECIAYPNDPRPCDAGDKNEAYTECSTLYGDAFTSCHGHIHPSIYVNSCVNDYCATSGDQYTLCESLRSYAAACHFAGVDLPDWEIGTACAEATTTAVPPTSPTSPNTTAPTPEQTSCPINCDFDKNLCGWEQLIQDSFDWTRQSGPTPSDLTGPNQDHTSGAGFYMYLEGDSVTHGDSARLLSPSCHFNGPLCLNFWYHMYGSATAMALNIFLLKDNRATKLWSKVNNQGPKWHPGNIDIKVSGPFQIIVEGIRGSDALSDVAIDDISIRSGSCSGSFPDQASGTELPYTTAEIVPSHPICNLDCSFDRHLCSWDQMSTDAFDWTWQRGSTPTQMTGPSADHTGGGHYYYIEASSASYGDTARLISSECSDSGPQCLQFWYHMYGSADTMGLHVYLLQDRLADAVFWKRNDQGNMWHLAQVDVETTGPFQFIIEGRRGSTDQSDVAIDDVQLYHGHCSDLGGGVTTHPPRPDQNATAPPSVPVPTTAAPVPPSVNVTAQPPVVNVTTPPTVEATTDQVSGGNVTGAPDHHPVCQLDCNFDQHLCKWNQMLTDAFDWTWHSGSTPTMITGPSSDHTTGGGHYLYIEANSASYGDTARLISSECSDSGPQCLQFWYHMHGSADTMGLHVYLLQDRLADAVFWKRNDQGNMWHLAQVDVETTGPFQLIFEGRRGSTDQSDVAIDDVQLYHGHCSDLGGVVTTHPPQPDQNATAPPSVPVPTTAAPVPPTVNVTAQPPVVNVTTPPTVEATTDQVSGGNVTEAPRERPALHSVCQLDCNFEQDLCQWSQLLTDVFDWTRHSGSTPSMITGPSSDHTTGGGHYLYIEANSASYGDTARLISSECSDSGPQCLQFWYHMYGSADTMGLHVYLLQDRLADAVFWKRNDQGNMWHLAQVDVETTGPFQFIFEGRRGSTDQSDVAIDDVQLYHGHCSDLGGVTTYPPQPDQNATAPPSVPVPTTAAPVPPTVNVTAQPPVVNVTTPPTVEATTDQVSGGNVTGAPDHHPVCQLDCNFDQHLCKWDQMPTDAFDWTWHSGSTPTMITGPSSDHTTGGGHYLYIEANSASYGDTARLISSECSDSGPQCLQFWYHMYGSADTMGLHVYLLQDRLADAVFWKRNDQGNMWHLAQVDLATTGVFQIIFEGRRGSNDQSDVAIDDVSLHRGHCAGLTKPTTPAPTTAGPQPPTTAGPVPPTTAGPLPPTTAGPVPPTTAGPVPPTTVRPQPPTTAGPQPPTTAGPVPPTTVRPQPPTTAGPVPPTTVRPQPPTTAGPVPPTTVRPQPPTTAGPVPPTTVRPQPPTTAGPVPPTTMRPQPPTTAGPVPPTTVRPQPPTTAGPVPPTTVRPQPPTTAGPVPPTTVRPQPPTTAGPVPPTTMRPQPPTTAGPVPPTTVRPQPPTTAGPVPPTTVRPQPPTTAGPVPPTTAEPLPPTTVRPQPPTTAGPVSPTTMRPQPPTTAGPVPPTTERPQPPTTAGPQPPTTERPQPPTTARPQPTTTRVPTPSCPENSHYTSCVSACSPTCTHLNGPPRCSDDEDCVPGCACDDGFVRLGMVCVPVQRCGCVDRNGNKHQFDDVWYTDHCSQKCECERDDGIGKIDCDDEDECDGDSVCLQNEEGNYYCQSTGFSECTINGDPEYKTFDKMKHDFEGEHSYVMVRTSNLPSNIPDVYIEGVSKRSSHDDHSSEEDHGHSHEDDSDEDHEDDDDEDDSEEHDEHYRIQGLKIIVYNHTVEFKKNRKLIVNGRKARTPLSPTAGLNIREHSSRIYLKTDFGLSVEFDGHSKTEIILPRIYRRKVGGLCGNFDGHKGNDLTKPDGTRAQSVQEFGESWRV